MSRILNRPKRRPEDTRGRLTSSAGEPLTKRVLVARRANEEGRGDSGPVYARRDRPGNYTDSAQSLSTSGRRTPQSLIYQRSPEPDTVDLTLDSDSESISDSGTESGEPDTDVLEVIEVSESEADDRSPPPALPPKQRRAGVPSLPERSVLPRDPTWSQQLVFNEAADCGLSFLNMDVDLSPDESRFVHALLGARSSKASKITPTLILVACLTNEGMRSVDTDTSSGSLAYVLGYILSMFSENKIFTLHPSTLDRSPDTVLLYGPDFNARAETSSNELIETLNWSKITSIKRISFLRRLTLSGNAAGLSRSQFEELINSVLLSNSVVSTSLRELSSALSRPPPSFGFPYADPLRRLILFKTHPNTAPLTEQASTLRTESSSRVHNLLSLKMIQMNLFDLLDLRRTTGALHAHSALYEPGFSISPRLFQKSLFPQGSFLCSTSGFYTPLPSVRDDDIRFAASRQLFHSFETQSREAMALQVPIVGGFLRSTSPPDSKHTLDGCICAGTNFLTSGSHATVEPTVGQKIVALGSPIPHIPTAVEPYLHGESTVNFNKILQVLTEVQTLVARPFISSMVRDQGNATNAEQIQALFPFGGAVLLASQLPESMIGSRAIQEERFRDTITNRFLLAHTNQVFLVITDFFLTYNDREMTPLSLLQHVASTFNCACHVIGIVTLEPGIHIINDLENPTDPLRESIDSFEAEFTYQVSKYADISTHDNEDEDEEDAGPGVPRAAAILDVDASAFDLGSTIIAALQQPAVASKACFVHHMDRCSNGLVMQQPGVGPFDTPICDYSLVVESNIFPVRTFKDASRITPLSAREARRVIGDINLWFEGEEDDFGEAEGDFLPQYGVIISTGEQQEKMKASPEIGVKYAIVEALTNIVSGPVATLKDVILTGSISWNEEELGALKSALFSAKEFCRDLGVDLTFTDAMSSVGVKNSPAAGGETVNSIVFTASALMSPSTNRVTPELKHEGHILVAISLSAEFTLQSSVFEKMTAESLSIPPDIRPQRVEDLFLTVRELIDNNYVKSAHDISDGGLITTLLEMALASEFSLDVHVKPGVNPLYFLMSETPGVVIETEKKHLQKIRSTCLDNGCFCSRVGTILPGHEQPLVNVKEGSETVWSAPLSVLRASWDSLSSEVFLNNYKYMNPAQIAGLEYGCREVNLAHFSKNCLSKYPRLFSSADHRLAVAVISLPGCTLPTSLCASFLNVGFYVVAVSVQDVVEGILNSCQGLIMGGQSGHRNNYLGARALAAGLSSNAAFSQNITDFSNRKNTFSLSCGELGLTLALELGILQTNNLRPSTELGWMTSNIQLEQCVSGVFESRWLRVSVPGDTNSLFLTPLKGMTLPCWMQGDYLGFRFQNSGAEYNLSIGRQIASLFQKPFSDQVATAYPANPTEVSDIAAISSKNGRHLGTLFDPSLVAYPWQWQHLPARIRKMKTSPWFMCFQCIYLWTLYS